MENDVGRGLNLRLQLCFVLVLTFNLTRNRNLYFSDISCNIFKYDERYSTNTYPYYLSKFGFERIVNILYLEKGHRCHFILIKSLGGLLKAKKKRNRKEFVCSNCLESFWSERKYYRHQLACLSETGQVIVMPEDDILRFKNFRYRFANIATVYVDWEAIQILVKSTSNNTDSTKLVTKHIPSGFGYVIVSPYPELCSKSVKIYRGKDCVEQFLSAMDLEFCRFRPYFYNITPIEMTEEELINHKNAKSCSICLKYFVVGDTICADHDHISGCYRGAAHRICNLNAKQQKKMIIYMHNAKG